MSRTSRAAPQLHSTHTALPLSPLASAALASPLSQLTFPLRMTTSFDPASLDLLASMGLSKEEAASLLASADDLIDQFGADTTVEKFLQMQCEKHVTRKRIHMQWGEKRVEKQCRAAIDGPLTHWPGCVCSVCCCCFVCQVAALQSYCDQRVQSLQDEAARHIAEVKAQWAQ